MGELTSTVRAEHVRKNNASRAAKAEDQKLRRGPTKLPAAADGDHTGVPLNWAEASPHKDDRVFQIVDKKVAAGAEGARVETGTDAPARPRLERVQLGIDVDFTRQQLHGRAALFFKASYPVDLIDSVGQFSDRLDVLELRVNLRCCTIRSVRLNGIPVNNRYTSPLDDIDVLRSAADRIYPPPTLEELEMMVARQARLAAHGELQVLASWKTLLASKQTLAKTDETGRVETQQVTKATTGSNSAPGTGETDSRGVIENASETAQVVIRPSIHEHERDDAQVAQTKPQERVASSIELCLEVEYSTCPDSPAVHFITSQDGDVSSLHASEGEKPDTLLRHDRWDTKQMPLPVHVDHVYVESHSGLASCWMPCLNPPNAALATSAVRCPFELEIVVPTGMIAIASGELKNSVLEQHTAPGNPSRTRFVFQNPEGVLASEIAFAAGSFRVLPDRVRPQSVTYFCLPGFVRQLVNTVDFLPAAMDFLEHYFGVPCPCPSAKFVFVDGALTHLPHTYAGGGLIILSSMLLFSDRVVDDVFSSHQRMVVALAAFWMRRLLRPMHTADSWLFLGVEEYVGALCLRKLFGNTWFRLYLRDTMKSVVESPGYLRWSSAEQPAAEMHEQSRRFAMLMISAIDRRAERKLEQTQLTAGSGVSRKHHPNRLDIGEGIRTVLHGLMLAPPKNRAIGLKPFLRLLERRAGVELLAFVRQYVSSNSLPIFQCGYHYDAKEHKIEIAVKQSVHRRNSGSAAEPTAFRGTLRFSIRESEEHYNVDLEITDSVHVFDVYCRTRKVGLGARGRAATSGADPAQTVAERITVSHDPILWIRVDPDMEWVRGVFWRQNERAWVRQLAGERDVLSQLECCDALYMHASATGVRGLAEHALLNEQVHYRVRSAAALSIARWGGSETRFLGLEILLDFYANRYFADERDLLVGADPVETEPPTTDQHARVAPGLQTLKAVPRLPDQDVSRQPSPGRSWSQRLPKPLDFGRNLAEYFLQRSVLRALGSIRVAQSGDGASRTPTDVFAMLDHVLRFHNNEANVFEDAYFLPDALLAFASTACTNEGLHTTEVYRCVHRFLNRDRLFPSHQNALTAGCIEAWAELVSEQHHQQQQLAEPGQVPEWTRIQSEFESFVWSFLLGPVVHATDKLSEPAVQAQLNEYLAHVWWLHRPFKAAVDGIVRTAGDRPEVVAALLTIARALPQPLYPSLVLQGMAKYATRTAKLATLLRSGDDAAARAVRETLHLYGWSRHPVTRQVIAEFFRAMWGSGEPAPLLTNDEYRRRLKRHSLAVPLGRVAPTSLTAQPTLENAAKPLVQSDRLEAPLIIRVQTAAAKEPLTVESNASSTGIVTAGTTPSANAGDEGTADSATRVAATEPVLVLRLPPIVDSNESHSSTAFDNEDQVYMNYVRSCFFGEKPH